MYSAAAVLSLPDASGKLSKKPSAIIWSSRGVALEELGYVLEGRTAVTLHDLGPSQDTLQSTVEEVTKQFRAVMLRGSSSGFVVVDWKMMFRGADGVVVWL
jgi:hypothetical protein